MKKSSVKNFHILLLIIIELNFFSAHFVYADEWSVLESESFIIRYIKDMKSAKEIQKIAEDFLPKVTANIDCLMDRKIDIWFCETRKEFNRAVNAPIQDWAVGCAYPLQARIIILDPVLSEYRRLDLERIVKHEITHVVFGLCIGENIDNVPKWFNEGIAMFISDDWGYGNYWTILTATIGNSLLPLSSISDNFPTSEYQVRLAYSQSFSIISFISKRYGNEAMKSCIRELAKGKTFNEALVTATGANIDWIESIWLKDLKKRYKWLSILSSGFILWGGIIFILWIAIFRQKWKNRKIMKQWEEEEKEFYWLEYDYNLESEEQGESDEENGKEIN
ncbi:MAG: peptidase MA family metallohydrolase [Candidatus Poribacteria bacterium]